MDAYRACVAAHLFLSVLLAGQTLYWLTMLAALRQKFPQHETARLLETVKAARWPHVLVPWRLRLPLPGVMALTLLAQLLTGAALMHLRGVAPQGGLWMLKWALVLAVTVLFGLLAARPRPLIIRMGFYAVLATIVTSAIVIR